MMKRKAKPRHLPIERVAHRILLIRGQRVMLDSDLAELYGVPTKRLNEQVKRNRRRFPADFMFQLTLGEKDGVVANCDHLQYLKFSSTLPYAFTEHGAVMLASVLNTKKAVQMSIFVVRAFIRLKRHLSTHRELARKFMELEQRIRSHDDQIQSLFEAIRQLMVSPTGSSRRIGFHT